MNYFIRLLLLSIGLFSSSAFADESYPDWQFTAKEMKQLLRMKKGDQLTLGDPTGKHRFHLVVTYGRIDPKNPHKLIFNLKEKISNQEYEARKARPALGPDISGTGKSAEPQPIRAAPVKNSASNQEGHEGAPEEGSNGGANAGKADSNSTAEGGGSFGDEEDGDDFIEDTKPSEESSSDPGKRSYGRRRI